MGHFVGGSAPAMVRQITEGYTLVNAVMLKRFTANELDMLVFEIEKKLREIRGEVIDVADIPATQNKNRRIGRLENALRVVRGTRQERFRRGG